MKTTTAAHMIFDVLEIASSGGLPNEQTISEELALYWIEQARAILIAQKLNKRDDIHDSWTSHINCLEMEQVDASLCCLAPSDCKVLRSVLQLPSTIDTWKDNLIISVKTMDGTSISKSNPIKQRYQQYNKYTRNDRSWCIIDNYLYIINDPYLEKVNVDLIVEFPSDLKRFVNCEGESCWTINSNYPVTLSLASEITNIVIATKVKPFLGMSNDTSNNANSVTPKQSQENKQTD